MYLDDPPFTRKAARPLLREHQGSVELIPVIDLLHGRAVHARRGERTSYAPVRSALIPEAVGDPLALARAYRRLGAKACYVADVDAIQGEPRQEETLRNLADPELGFGPNLWMDAGIRRAPDAERVLACGADKVIIALETVESGLEVPLLVRAVGVERAVFSLDLRRGRPLRDSAIWGSVATALDFVLRSGVRRVLLLDLARIGSGEGVDLDLVRTVRRQAPSLELYVGGGIRGAGDLRQLERAGVTGALLATSLHSGALTSLAPR